MLAIPVPIDVQQHEEVILAELGIVKYRPEFYNQIAAMMPALGTFYDGHGEGNGFLDQLVDRDGIDPQGYFTKRKNFLVLPHPEDPNQVGAFIVLNFKRGGSVKIGPFVVHPDTRGMGMGKSLLDRSEEYLRRRGGVRKMYATTAHLNHPVNNVLASRGFEVEARYPSHYKQGSEELIWGKFLEQPSEPSISDTRLSVFTDVEETLGMGEIEVVEFHSGLEPQVRQLVVESMRHWHGDMDQSFVTGMLDGAKRGLDFESKGKVVFVAVSKADRDQVVGVATLTPKRGNPAKLYPIIGTEAAQKMLAHRAIDLARELGLHKVYTFAPEALKDQHRTFVEDLGMADRGRIQSPYKDGVDMRTFDIFT